MGVIAEQQGLTEKSREEQGSKDEKTRCGEVDNIRVKLLKRRVYASEPEGQGNTSIQREAKARNVNYLGACKLCGGVRVIVRDNNKDLIAGVA